MDETAPAVRFATDFGQGRRRLHDFSTGTTMRLQQLVEGGGEISRRGELSDDPVIEDIVLDSRQVGPGSLFAALPGRQVDGHDFIGAAVDAGASAILAQSDRRDEVSAPVPIVWAEDTRRSLGPLSAHFFDHPSRELDVVGVTGTNGKTTTCAILESVFRETGRRVGVIGTVGYRWGAVEIEGANTTPESLLLQRLLRRMSDDGVDLVVMEVSSHALATHRMRGMELRAALFTNLSQDHLDFHGDMSSYRATKERRFRRVLPRSAAAGRSASAVLNVDDPVGAELAGELEEEAAGIDVWRFSSEGNRADVQAESVEQTLQGTRLRIESGGELRRVDVPLFGDFNASNCSGAASVGLALGLDLAQVGSGLASVGAIPGRLERVSGAEQPAVFVDYAHTPHALRRLLATLAPLTNGRLIVVFGCGGDRDAGKRPKMGRAAREGADLAVVTSDNPRSEDPDAIIAQILEGIDAPAVDTIEELRGWETGVAVVSDRGRAIAEAIALAGPDDAVVIAGKGHEDYQEIDGERRPFDDAARAREALQATR